MLLAQEPLLLILLPAALILVVALALLEHKYYITEYLFFVRYPILLTLILASLPILGPAIASDSLRNIFILQPIGIGVV